MDVTLQAWVASFKQLDLKRSQAPLSPEDEAQWVKLKGLIEHATSVDEGPPSGPADSIRVPADYIASFEDPDGFRKAYLRHISEGGVYIESGDRWKMGDRFKLNMTLAEPPVSIDQEVQVVWVNANPSPGSGLEPGVGVAFLNLPADKKSQIKAIVHNRLDELVAQG